MLFGRLPAPTALRSTAAAGRVDGRQNVTHAPAGTRARTVRRTTLPTLSARTAPSSHAVISLRRQWLSAGRLLSVADTEENVPGYTLRTRTTSVAGEPREPFVTGRRSESCRGVFRRRARSGRATAAGRSCARAGPPRRVPTGAARTRPPARRPRPPPSRSFAVRLGRPVKSAAVFR